MSSIKPSVHRLLAGVGINLYWIRHPDRRVLERVIIRHLARDPALRRVLFVGCDWYTQGYERLFDAGEYCTIDFDASKRRFGARSHLIDSLEHLGKYFEPATLDLIVCNGVFGWGLDARAAVEAAFAACYEVLRPGGLFVLGWNDIPERRPFPLGESRALARFEPTVFAPLGTAEYRTQTPYAHVFSFFRRPDQNR